eukprot:CAMPEP_0172194826 /NCGR_PEP_ID=MMETSP1050-20130122/25832_1 /TAXON_ID=233186 /ORGANISM="Cryptomonas curvata, Strain CCAP979/52" /LENGTH=74 /DNA_ID=CAMNT_0012870749 /DNA_START=24 /DNA_END=248 /DNA_ORIENTATION=+
MWVKLRTVSADMTPVRLLSDITLQLGWQSTSISPRDTTPAKSGARSGSRSVCDSRWARVIVPCPIVGFDEAPGL